ncbi:MAG TPA: hypothetical protein VG321_09025 [Solirubrobacteraceae bacterium]|jgi:hypothetical protein|nr:hypothetical protein [Solirubrobacteraceae bacterium]
MSAAAEIAGSLAAVPDRGVGTDAERRSAIELAEVIRRPGRRDASLEPFWCRPNWAMAQAWHTGLGVAGSLVSVSSHWVGAGLLAAALISTFADAFFAVSPGRRLTREHASQNVVSPAPGSASADVRLIITANLDAARQGVGRRALSGLTARLRSLTGGRAPGWAGWLMLALALALAAALLRATGTTGTAVKVLQLVPTAGLVIALALLLELAAAAWGPGPGDNASGVGVAVALARALDAAPPAHATVELVLTGAGDGEAIGLSRYLRGHRDRRPSNTIVLGIGPCTGTATAWLRSDGPLFPLGYSAILRRLCQQVAGSDPALGLHELRSRGSSPALAARQAGIPAVTLTSQGAPDETATERVLLVGLALTDAIDAYLGELRQG